MSKYAVWSMLTVGDAQMINKLTQQLQDLRRAPLITAPTIPPANPKAASNRSSDRTFFYTLTRGDGFIEYTSQIPCG